MSLATRGKTIYLSSYSAYALQALGVAIDLGPDGVAACLRESNVGFMYAPRYHPAMRAVRPVRAALKASFGGHAGCEGSATSVLF